MNKESEQNEYALPSEGREEFNFSVNTSAFEQDLRLLIERNDRNEEGVIDAILLVGHELVIAKPDVSFGLRPKIGGNDEVIDLMDPRFSYDKNAVVGDKKIIRNYYIPEEGIDIYMEKANELGMEMDELFGRILQAGMHLFAEVRENGKNAYKERGDRRFFMKVSMPSQKKKLKKRLSQFYLQYDNQSQSPDSAQH